MTETTRPVPVCVRAGVLTQSEYDHADPRQQAEADHVVDQAEAGTSPEWFKEHRWWIRDQLAFFGGITMGKLAARRRGLVMTELSKMDDD